MAVILREPWTIERFLSWEDRQETRHEFDGTRILEMTGSSRAHQRIVLNLAHLLMSRLDATRFDVLQEMRIASGGKVRYPDVAVCHGPVPDGTKTLQDALVLFEVLSPDTAVTDRGEKRADYAGLPGLRHYVLVEQDQRAAVVLTRTAEGWTEAPPATGSEVALPALGLTLDLNAIYAGTAVPVQRRA